MKAGLKLKDYCRYQKGRENQHVSLPLLFEPFACPISALPDECLLLGIVIDSLIENYDVEDWITPIDLAFVASDLGYNEAQHFLEDAEDVFKALMA